MESGYKLRRTDRGWHQWEMACFTDREVGSQFVTRLERFKIGGGRPPVEISFRNLIWRGTIEGYAIVCGTGQQFALRRAGRFGTPQ
jgi:hypothetical protein